MESHRLPADDLPVLYRTILDGVAVLERGGARAEAASIRVAATQAYSTAWDGAGVRRLERLAERCRLAVLELEGGPVGRRTRGERSRRLRRLAPLFR